MTRLKSPRFKSTSKVLLATAALFAATPAFAGLDCPDLGLTGAKNERFCDEFRDLLYAPARPNANRGVAQKSAKRARPVIESDPLWGEVFRADPERTLDLIARIKRAGGALPTE